MSTGKAPPQHLVGHAVVVDTSSHFVYLGTLKSADEHFVELEDADVHDSTESKSSNEVYIIEAKKYGIKRNRKTVFVRWDLVVSISGLEDIIEY